MNIALILAGGTGSRMGADCPKQFLKFDEDYIFIHTIKAFTKSKQIDKIALVCHPDWIEFAKKTLNDARLFDIILISGGKTRQESCFLGLLELEKSFAKSDIILIHDAARPFVSNRIIKENIEVATENSAAVTVINSTDTILLSEGEFVEKIPDRSIMYQVQTPQSFRLSLILEGHRGLTEEQKGRITDDSSILVEAKIPVAIVLGDRNNFKITTKIDLELAKIILELKV